MTVELFEIPVSLLHRDDQAQDLLEALIPYDAYNWQAAVAPLEEVARTGNVLALFKYANTLGHLDEAEAAEHFWRIAIAAGHTDSCNNLANLLKNQGRNDEVLPLYMKAAEAGASDAMFNIGILIEDEDPSAGEQWLLKAVEAGHARACSNLALKYFGQDRIDEAFKLAELGIERGCLYAAGAIAIYHQRREEYEFAIKAAERAFPLFNASNYGDQVHIYNLLASCQMLLGRLDEAEETIKHCREHNSDLADDLTEAIAKYRAALAAEAQATPKFCPNCGTPVGEGNSFCTGCGKSLTQAQAPNNSMLTKNTGTTPAPTTEPSEELVVTQKVEGTSFAAFEHYLDTCEELITPYINGAISIDGGMLSIAGEALPACETCYGYSETSPQFNCEKCGRTTDNYIHVRSGFGDGIYLNYDLYWGKVCGGTITILDQGNEFAGNVYENLIKIRAKDAPYNQTMLDFWEMIHSTDKNLELHYFGQITSKMDSRWSNESKPYGSLFFGDAGEGIDSLAAVVYSKNMPVDNHLVYGFCERNDKGVLIPRLVLTLREELATKLGMPTSNPNMAKEHDIWQHAGVFASMGGRLKEQAVQINVATEYASLEDPTFDELTIQDHQTLLVSWFIIQHYQGSLPADVDEYLNDLTLDMVKTYLRFRTCFGLAYQLTTWPPASKNKLI